MCSSDLSCNAYGAILLDRQLPDGDGLTLIAKLRTKGVSVPVIVLTARGELVDRVAGLDSGADDYLGKPFNPRELLARIKAVLRRVTSLPPQKGGSKAKQLKFDRWQLDVGRRELVDSDGVAVPLSTAEYRLLCAFLEHA